VSRWTRALSPAVIPILVVVAIVGYLVGIHRPSTPASEEAPAGATRVASGSGVLLAYPSSWRPTADDQTIPGLAIAHPLLLAPGGDSARAGLVSGKIPGGAPSPLPPQFVSLVRGIPRAEVVNLANAQAYRYSKLKGYRRALDLYVVPIAGSRPTALVCYAADGFANYLRQCEDMVSDVTLVGQTSYNLVPDGAYAGQLGATLSALNRQRAKLRGEIHQRANLASVRPLAAGLAARFATAAAAVDALEPPQAASAAQTALTSSLTQAHDAYTALASAAAAEDAEAYEAAQRQIDQAESSVDVALKGYALLGYGPD
jgi:hypothetical protein